MSEGSRRPRWRTAVEGFLARLEEPEIHLGQLFMLWATVLAVVFLTCVAFFIALYWVIN